MFAMTRSVAGLGCNGSDAGDCGNVYVVEEDSKSSSLTGC
jgi:hypothetical protein